MSKDSINDWSFEWVTDWSMIWAPSFTTLWRDLLSAPQNTPFFHPAIVSAWVKTYGGENAIQPSFLLARKNGDLSLLWPLVRLKTTWKQAYLRRIHPVGNWVFDFHDPVNCLTEGLGEGFWNAIKRELGLHGSTFCDSFDIPRVRRITAGEGTESWPTNDTAPFVCLDGYHTMDSFMDTRKSSLRVDVRRQIKRLKADGSLGFRVYDSSSVSEVLTWIPELEANRAEKYPGARLPSGYLNNLVMNGITESVVHCSAVTLDGQAISWHIGFVWQGVMYWYIPLYDSKFSSYSPGKVHLYYAIEWAIANDLKVFDFLRGVETYKAGWTDGQEHTTVSFQRDTPGLISVGRRRLSRVGNYLGYCRSRLSSKSNK